MMATGRAALPLLLAGDGFATSVRAGVTVTPSTLPPDLVVPLEWAFGLGRQLSSSGSGGSGVGVTRASGSPQVSE